MQITLYSLSCYLFDPMIVLHVLYPRLLFSAPVNDCVECLVLSPVRVECFVLSSVTKRTVNDRVECFVLSPVINRTTQ